MLSPLTGGIDIARPLRYVSHCPKIAFKFPILGGVVIVGGKPVPVPPWDPLRRDALIALAVSELATRVDRHESRNSIINGALDALELTVKQMRVRNKREAVANTKKSESTGKKRQKLN